MAARFKKSCEASPVRADGVVWSRNFLTTPPRPLRLKVASLLLLDSRPPLLLLRRGSPSGPAGSVVSRMNMRRLSGRCSWKGPDLSQGVGFLRVSRLSLSRNPARFCVATLTNTHFSPAS